MRCVANVPNKEGLIELGPFCDRPKLGDLLLLTPAAKALGKKAVMVMPESMRHLAWIFDGLCPVRISENYPQLDHLSARCHVATFALSKFSLHDHSPIPEIRVSPAWVRRAKEILWGVPNPIAFVPTCSAEFEFYRQRPFVFWKPVVAELSKRYTVCQFGREEYPLVPGARRVKFEGFQTLAGLYSVIGNYVGVVTGDYHLMLAVGGRCVTALPEPLPPGEEMCWCYRTPRVVYARLNHPDSVLEAIRKIGF